MDHPSRAANGLVEPNPGIGTGGGSYDCGMATLLVEREREPARLRFPATSTPTSTSTPSAASRPASRHVRRDGTRAAVYASTPGKREPHFIGWRDEVDVDRLFASGAIYGITIRRVRDGHHGGE